MKNYLTKILITGSNGQLGTALRKHPLAEHFHIMPYSRIDLDITDLPAVKRVFAAIQPDIVINTAAYTAVDKAEIEEAVAMNTNYLSVEQLALLCHKLHIPLIHLSTDYIFDGEKKIPYTEEDNPLPLNVYGKSKWLGEEAIRYYCEQHIILRVSSVFSQHGNNFVKAILHLAKIKKELRIVSDQISCPTSATDIAYALYVIIKQLSNFGTYHYCSTPAQSWFQFASIIFEKVKHKDEIILKELQAITAKEYGSMAKRPAYSVLNCNKIAIDYGLLQPSWQVSLEEMIHDGL